MAIGFLAIDDAFKAAKINQKAQFASCTEPYENERVLKWLGYS
jgi:hypothetical protein